MNKRTFTGLLAAFTLVAINTGCNKEDDEAPVIQELSINGMAVGTEMDIYAGDVLEISFRVTDNEALNQVKIDIHANDDGHSHDGHDHGGEGAFGNWETLEIIDVSGTEETITRNITVPQTIIGEWHFGVLALDETGNEADEVFTDLDIDNEFIPHIHVDAINGADVPDELDADEGDVLTFEGEITDSDGLAHVEFEIKDEDGNTLTSVEYDPAGAVEWDMSAASITVPAIPDGHGELHIHAEDTEGFEYEWELELHQD